MDKLQKVLISLCKTLLKEIYLVFIHKKKLFLKSVKKIENLMRIKAQENSLMKIAFNKQKSKKKDIVHITTKFSRYFRNNQK